MTVDVRIPSLGESVSEGVIVRWARQDGDNVRADEVLLELETDKASMEIPARSRTRWNTATVANAVAVAHASPGNTGIEVPQKARRLSQYSRRLMTTVWGSM